MLFHFNNFSIDVDVERTRNYYRESTMMLTEGCDCPDCRNFAEAYEGFDPRIRDFFESLGVDIRKAPDMSAMHGDGQTNTLYYLGFCHLCGRILSGKSAWVSDTPNSGHWDEGIAFAVTESCRVSFSDRCALVDPAFPRPVIQMDVDIQVPWLFEEQHYLLT